MAIREFWNEGTTAVMLDVDAAREAEALGVSHVSELTILQDDRWIATLRYGDREDPHG